MSVEIISYRPGRRPGRAPSGGARLLSPFYLILVRLTLELYVAMIRTAQNTAATTSELGHLRWELSQRR